MRIRWIGDARQVRGIGIPVTGREYDVDDGMGASLVEQGKAVVASPEPPPLAPPVANPEVWTRPETVSPVAGSSDEEE